MVLVQCLGSRSSSETWKEAPVVIQVRDDGGTDQGRGSGGGEKWLNSRYIWHSLPLTLQCAMEDSHVV